jgi:hypothetical protein
MSGIDLFLGRYKISLRFLTKAGTRVNLQALIIEFAKCIDYRMDGVCKGKARNPCR